MRKSFDRKIRIALAVVYAVIILIEAALVLIGNSHNQMELLTVSFNFFQLMVIFIVIDLPVFLLIAVTVSAIKEIALRMKGECDPALLKLSSTSVILTALTFALFVATSNTTSPELNGILYCLTLASALASATVFAVYIVKNRKAK